MKIQLSVLIFLCQLVAQSYTQFSRDDFEVCYEACRTNFSDSLGRYTGADKQTYLNNLFDYEQCVTNISLQAFRTYYSSTSITVTDNGNKQNGYCKYFFSVDKETGYNATEINQKQLQTLVEGCFQDGCAYTATGGTANENAGTYHFTQSFETCIDTCIKQTTHEDQKLYEIAVNACQEAYNSGETNASSGQSVDSNAYDLYKQCIRDNKSCGQLYFYDFTDFQYSTYWGECHNPCIDIYNADEDVAADTADNSYVGIRKAYFTCLKGAPIPDADSFTRLDNTVETGSQILYISVAIVLSVFSLII